MRCVLGLFLVALIQLPILMEDLHLVSHHHEDEHQCTDPTLHFHAQPDHIDCWVCHFSFSHFDAALYFPSIPVCDQLQPEQIPVSQVFLNGLRVALEPQRGPPTLS